MKKGVADQSLDSVIDITADTPRLLRRLERERIARLQAEAIAEQSTAALYRKQQDLLLLQQITAASNQAEEVFSTYQAALDLVCHYMGWPVGHIYTVHSSCQLHPTKIWHLDDPHKFDVFKRVTEETLLEIGAGLPGRVLQDRCPVWVCDVTQDGNFPRSKLAENIGVRAGIAFPIMVGVEIVAVAEFFAPHVADQDASILELMTNIGTQLGRVVERYRAREKLIHDALHDALTGLPNRTLFMSRLEHAFLQAKRHPHLAFAVLFINIDRFKIINKSLGIAAGDKLLTSIAQRINASVRRSDTFARLDGDEFALLIETLKDPSGAVCVAEHLHEQCHRPIRVNELEVFSSISVGIAYHDQRYEKPEDLVRDASLAMLRAKEQGKSQYALFDELMHQQAMTRLRVENHIHQSVARQELRIHYQPIVSLSTGQVTSFEALVRWQHPEMGFVSPAQFIPIAEETGAIIFIGRWVLYEACRQLNQWKTETDQAGPISVSVNLSARQLAHAGIINEVMTMTRETGLSLDALKLEVTESAVIKHPETAAHILAELQKLGIKLLLDDFGTGYSSLSYLHQFAMDSLKIDGSFVRRLGTGGKDAEMVRIIVLLAQSLGMDVIAECVETVEQLRELRKLGCHYAQGYYFSKPVDAAAAEKLLGHRYAIDVDMNM